MYGILHKKVSHDCMKEFQILKKKIMAYSSTDPAAVKIHDFDLMSSSLTNFKTWDQPWVINKKNSELRLISYYFRVNLLFFFVKRDLIWTVILTATVTQITLYILQKY